MGNRYLAVALRVKTKADRCNTPTKQYPLSRAIPLDLRTTVCHHSIVTVSDVPSHSSFVATPDSVSNPTKHPTMSYPDPRYGSTPLEQTVTSATSDTPRATDSGEEPQSTDGVRRRQQLTFADKKHVCEIARANPNLAHLQIGKIFGVERSTISRTLRESQYWLNRDAQTGSHLTRRRYVCESLRL